MPLVLGVVECSLYIQYIENHGREAKARSVEVGRRERWVGVGNMETGGTMGYIIVDLLYTAGSTDGLEYICVMM